MEAAASAQGSQNWRQSTMIELYKLSNETLAAMKGLNDPTRLAEAIVHAKRVAPKALGDQDDDLVFTPTPGGPCRYIDTRDVGGKISGTRSYDLDLNNYAANIGGHCGSDPYTLFGGTLAALALNMAIVDPSVAPGVATIVPSGAGVNNALMNWYNAGPTVQASNSAIVPIDQTIGPPNEIDIFASASVHVIVDIFGAFRASEATALQCTNVTGTVTTLPANSTNTLAPAPSCPTGYTRVGLECDTNSNAARLLGYNDSGCFSANSSAVAGTVTATSKCCRVPGR
jgi:hypothetical protein